MCKDKKSLDKIDNNNNEQDYTFVRERIVKKRHRIFKVLTKLLIHLLVPVCVCLFVLFIYIKFIDKTDKDIEEKPQETSIENSIKIDRENFEEQVEPDVNIYDLDKEENLIRLEESIKKMVVVISVVREKEEETSTEVTAEGETPEVVQGDENTQHQQVGLASENEYIEKCPGVVVSMQGSVYILIPRGRIEGYKKLYATIGAETTLATNVYAIDKETDLALLRIPADKITSEVRGMLSVATFGGSNQVSEGSAIVYCGNIVGNTPMFMKGHISNSSNQVKTIDMNYKVLLTDINMGDVEDGFLFNARGNLVGIIGISTGNIEVPSVIAGAKALDLEYIINNMLNGKRDIYFGIMGQEVSAEIEEIAGSDMPRGIYVDSVMVDSPAYNTGILAGDIIVSINSINQPNMNDFRDVLEQQRIGGTVVVRVKRKIGNAYNEFSMHVILDTRE